MNYIDKEKSIKADIAGIENRVRHAFNQGYDFGFKDGKEKAKSQESVLDKLRAEIASIAINGMVDEHTMFIRTGEQVKKMALDIIDKYKGESEE